MFRLKKVKKNIRLKENRTLQKNVRRRTTDIFCMKYFVTAAILLAPLFSMSQLFDEMLQSFNTKPILTAKISTRNSFITNSFMRMRDVGVGLNFDNVTKVGLGYNWLTTDVIRPLELTDQEVQNNEGELKMRYLTAFIEYTFLKKKRYNFSIPVQVGIGRAFFRYQTISGNNQNTKPVTVAFYEPAFTAEYTGIKYIGIGLGAGYRLMLLGSQKLDDNYNAPVYLFKFKVYFGDIINDVHN